MLCMHDADVSVLRIACMLLQVLRLLCLAVPCAEPLHCHVRDGRTQSPHRNPTTCRLQAFQWPFILYGDSLTEMWKGTQACQNSAARKGFDALRQKYLSPLSNADGMSGALLAGVEHPVRVDFRHAQRAALVQRCAGLCDNTAQTIPDV